MALGHERQIDLADEQVPLNQNGDNISLLNSAGNEIDSVEFPSGQISSGCQKNSRQNDVVGHQRYGRQGHP
jgi:hypothetical protein